MSRLTSERVAAKPSPSFGQSQVVKWSFKIVVRDARLAFGAKLLGGHSHPLTAIEGSLGAGNEDFPLMVERLMEISDIAIELRLDERRAAPLMIRQPGQGTGSLRGKTDDRCTRM